MSENPDSRFCLGYAIADFLQSAKQSLDRLENQPASQPRGIAEDLRIAQIHLRDALEIQEEIGPVKLASIQEDLKQQLHRLQKLGESEGTMR